MYYLSVNDFLNLQRKKYKITIFDVQVEPMEKCTKQIVCVCDSQFLRSVTTIGPNQVYSRQLLYFSICTQYTEMPLSWDSFLLLRVL